MTEDPSPHHSPAVRSHDCWRRRSPSAHTPGKFADLVVLNGDDFTVSDESLNPLRSVLTVGGGRITHDSGAVQTRDY